MSYPPFVIALIAAGVGALVSSVITEIGRWRERTSRREELALTKAAELSQQVYQVTIDLVKAGRGVTMMPQTQTIANGYLMFLHLLKHGTLDPHSQAELDKELREYAARQR